MTNLRKRVHNYFREYCESTSIHGLRYLGEKRTLFEKIWWIIVIGICLTSCIFAIYTVYVKWEQSPVIVTFANRETPIYEIPFPSVTICPETKSEKQEFDYSAFWKSSSGNFTKENSTEFDYMSLICINPYNTYKSNRTTVSEDFYDYVDSVKPLKIFLTCKYLNQELNCEKMFSPIFTEEGVCYSFNMLDRTDLFREDVVQYRNYQKFNTSSSQWNAESGYFENASIDTYPKRALLSGARSGILVLLVTQSENLDYLCRDMAIQGYKVAVHPPSTYPLPTQEYFRVPLDESVVVAIQPSLITTSPSLKSYSTKRRRCYFQSERYLKYFKLYTATNCDQECLSNYTLDLCDCVAFYMPRDNNTKICGPGKMQCMQEAENFMLLKNINYKFAKSEKRKRSYMDCDCLPLCTDLSYDFETSQAAWNWKKIFAALGLNFVDPKLHLSLLEIYFKKDDFITSERNEFYGPIDFLANFGGILGLFTGVSVLSVLEIFYFLTVRVVCNRWLYKNLQEK